MHNRKIASQTSINVNESYEGETLEQKIERIVHNNEPIKDGAPLIYTERKDGVRPEYDIRTDRWDLAIDAMDKVAAANIAKREGKVVDMKTKEGKSDAGKGDSNATDSNSNNENK
ncbi:MAG: hypothetical protein [Malazfec virus 4]